MDYKQQLNALYNIVKNQTTTNTEGINKLHLLSQDQLNHVTESNISYFDYHRTLKQFYKYHVSIFTDFQTKQIKEVFYTDDDVELITNYISQFDYVAITNSLQDDYKQPSFYKYINSINYKLIQYGSDNSNNIKLFNHPSECEEYNVSFKHKHLTVKLTKNHDPLVFYKNYQINKIDNKLHLKFVTLYPNKTTATLTAEVYNDVLTLSKTMLDNKYNGLFNEAYNDFIQWFTD